MDRYAARLFQCFACKDQTSTNLSNSMLDVLEPIDTLIAQSLNSFGYPIDNNPLPMPVFPLEQAIPADTENPSRSKQAT